MDGPFLAVDWGTTNRRVYAIDAAGNVVRTERDDRGILSVRPDQYEGEVAAIRDRFGRLPMLCAGMVGSNRGWREAPYLDAPVDLASLASRSILLEASHTAIIPGVRKFRDGRADVMRGEEVQLLGAVSAGLTDKNALLCQPGTHCKWAWIADGRLADFTTAMTGEIFAMLRQHSLLADLITGPVAIGPAFRAGVDEARKGDLLASLFAIRASSLVGALPAGEGAAFASGLMIGTDVAARLGKAIIPGHVDILADPALGSLYGAAIGAFGHSVRHIDSHAAFVAGITQIWRLMQ